MDEEYLANLETSYSGDERILNLIKAYRSLVYSERKVAEKISNLQKMEAIANMAAGIAHDFNNILMGIQGNVSLFAMRNDLQADTHLSQINTLIENGNKLTSQILSYSSRQPGNTLPVNLTRIIKNTLDTYLRANKNISVHTNIDDQPSMAKMVPGQFEQVLYNILINAGHAMIGEKRDIYVNLHGIFLSENETENIGDLNAGKYTKISITDTGTGMDDTTRQRIFEPYFTTKKNGTGLGLSIAYNIIRKHKGILTVYSEKGKGSTFNIYIPDYCPNDSIVDDAKRKNSAIRGCGTILVVDDEMVNLDVVIEYLTILGYKAMKASGGKNAITIYEKLHKDINLVLLDMTMPEIGGIEVLKKIREKNADAKVLLMSGLPTADHLAKKEHTGFIQKPFTLEILSQKVHETLA